MLKLTDAAFESLYRDFLNIRDEWQTLVQSISIHHDTAVDDRPFRYVGMTASPSVLARARELQQRWQQFAEIADMKRANGVYACNTALYTPVPQVIGGFKSFSLNQYKATCVKKLRREEILLKLKARLESTAKELTNPYNVPEIQRDIKAFDQYPPGTLFRLRIKGYNDLFIDFVINETTDERYRVGTYGVILDASGFEGDVPWKINDGSTIQYDSVYELLTPIRCSLYSNCELYLLDEVERVKEIAKKENRLRSKRNYEEKRKARRHEAKAARIAAKQAAAAAARN